MRNSAVPAFQAADNTLRATAVLHSTAMVPGRPSSQSQIRRRASIPRCQKLLLPVIASIPRKPGVDARGRIVGRDSGKPRDGDPGRDCRGSATAAAHPAEELSPVEPKEISGVQGRARQICGSAPRRLCEMRFGIDVHADQSCVCRKTRIRRGCEKRAAAAGRLDNCGGLAMPTTPKTLRRLERQRVGGLEIPEGHDVFRLAAHHGVSRNALLSTDHRACDSRALPNSPAGPWP